MVHPTHDRPLKRALVSREALVKDARGRPLKRGRQLHGHARRVAAGEMQTYMRRLAQSIRDARLERGVAISELAAATGLNEHNLYRIERAEHARTPTLLTIVRIARALDMQPSELVP